MLLVIDNYDSFTFNLVQYLGELGTEPVVRRNDEITVDQIEQLDPDRIVISPGPCTPAEAGISIECVRRMGPRRPLLGVCLGHQAIGSAFGARVVRAHRPVHGKVSNVTHDGIDLFAGLPTPLTVARYHSLVIDPSTLPEELEVIGWTSGEHETEEVQAIRHRDHPIWGVQFHPESIASKRGKSLLKNFLSLG